jgi:uncharacterized Zn-binding protein involved in type VI secretion
MTDRAVARVLLDQAGPGNLIISTPQSTVFVELIAPSLPAFCLAATVGAKMKDGSIIPTGDSNVFIEDKKVATEGTASSSGATIGKSSPTVFVGND